MGRSPSFAMRKLSADEIAGFSVSSETYAQRAQEYRVELKGPSGGFCSWRIGFAFNKWQSFSRTFGSFTLSWDKITKNWRADRLTVSAELTFF